MRALLVSLLAIFNPVSGAGFDGLIGDRKLVNRSMLRLCPAILVLVFSISVAGLFPAEAPAAQIFAPETHVQDAESSSPSDMPSDPPRCDVRLTGRIETGDADTFKNVVGQLKHEHAGRTIFVCLDSEGGDLGAALQIARYIRWLGDPGRNVLFWKGSDSAIITVVDAQAQCESACALIFMAGSGLTSPARFLHPRGRLIFHTSFISIPDRALRKMVAQGQAHDLKNDFTELLYNEGLQDFRNIISIFDAVSPPGGSLLPPWVRPSLFLEAFSQGPEELFCIDTVDQVGRWGIQLYGVAAPKEITKPMIRNACENTFHWRQDSSAWVDDLPVFWTPLEEEIGGRNVWSAGFDSRAKVIAKYNYTQCVAEMSGNAQTKIFYADSSGRRVSAIDSVAVTAFFAPDTLLPEIANTGAAAPASTDGGARGTSPSLAGFREYPDHMMSGCNLRRIDDSDVASCQAACDKATECLAYSFYKISRTCVLKHSLTAMRQDPLWTSGVQARFPAKEIPQSQRQFIMERPLPDPPGVYVARDLVGNRKQDLHMQSRGQCDNKCVTDSKCLGYSFYGDSPGLDGGRCVLFSRIDNVVTGYAESEVKRQR
jgi:ATP-dependent protease ClpP protease subunit